MRDIAMSGYYLCYLSKWTLNPNRNPNHKPHPNGNLDPNLYLNAQKFIL